MSTISETAISETLISHKLTTMLNDTYTFKHANGETVVVQVQPRKNPDGRLTLYEPWPRVRRGRSSRLLTERGFEIVFDVPILFEYHLEQNGYPQTPQGMIERFFAAMVGEDFKHHPKALFR